MQGIDLFSGAGGMSIGAGMSGVDVKLAIELNQAAAATFRLNHPETNVLEKDIRKVKGDEFSALDRNAPSVIFGGPPCQGFSTSNQKNRNSENENNWLFKEYLRLVRKVAPDWVVFENVKGLLETENGYFLDRVLKGFKRAGYTTSHFVLNSADYGVPQRRNRLFIIGSRHGKIVSEPPKLETPFVTVADALDDLPQLCNGNTVDEREYAKEASNSYAISMRQGLNSCHNHLVTRNSEAILNRYSHIPQGGNWENIPKTLMENYTDVTRCHTGIYRRLKNDEPSIVIGNFRKNMLIHPVQNRGLSVREAARLQSFPDHFRFVGSIGFQQQQVGNAVPPLLAKAVFEQIIKNT